MVDVDALDHALAGAVLMELMLAGRLALADGRVTVADPAPTGDPIADEVLAAVGAEQKPQPPKEWVHRLSTTLRDRVLDRLVERGILRRERDKVLWVIPYTRYPSATGTEPLPETELRQRLRAVVDGTEVVDARTGALCALIRTADMAEAAVPGRDAARVHDRLAAVAATSWPDDAVRQAMADVEAAIQVAITTSTMTMLHRTD